LPLALRIEIDENAQRKSLTQSELARLQRRILEEVHQHATPGARNDLQEGTYAKNFAQAKRATGVVGRLFGESDRQVEKRLAVVAAAESEPKKFGDLVEIMDETGRVDRAFKQLQIIQRQEEHASRAEQGCTVCELTELAASGKRFGVIYADPPWPWDTWGSGGRVHTCADQHYGLTTVDAIKALPVARLAADDCALFLWCTGPHMAIGNHVEVFNAWGFEPGTFEFIWIKTTQSATIVTLDGEGLHWGNGYSTRSNGEVCLIATKGSPLRLATNVHQVVLAPVGEHSAKPDEVRRRIERLFGGPYLELYGRKLVSGWTVWGNEIPRADFPPYDPVDDVNKSVAEGFKAIRQRKAEGGPGWGEPTDYLDMPDFLIRKPKDDDVGRR
jgi:N6-adenosine-specific RNA methylase IME4